MAEEMDTLKHELHKTRSVVLDFKEQLSQSEVRRLFPRDLNEMGFTTLLSVSRLMQKVPRWSTNDTFTRWAVSLQTPKHNWTRKATDAPRQNLC